MKTIIKVILIVSIVVIALSNVNNYLYKSKEEVKVDTIVKVVEIPKIVKDTVFKELKPVKEYVYIDNSKKLLKQLKNKHKKDIDSLVLLKELIESKKERLYKKTLEDSTQKIDVSVLAEGKVKEISIKAEQKQRSIYTYNTITTKKIKPKFRVYGGINDVLGINRPSLSVQDKRGFIYGVSYDINESQYIFEFKIPLITSY